MRNALVPKLLMATLMAGAALPGAGPAALAAPAPTSAAKARATAGAAVQEAIALRRASRFEEAAKLLLDHLATYPDDARAHHELGVLYALHGQIREAEAQFRDALLADPGSGETRLALAELLRADERCKEALAVYSAVTQADPGQGAAWKGQVLCHSQLGAWEPAMAAAKVLISQFPGTTLGRWASERLEKLKEYATSGEVTPAQMDAEGKALFAEKRYEAAAVWLAMALQSEPNADRAYRLAMAQLGAQELLAAHAALQHAIRLDARHQPALMALPVVARALRNAGSGGESVGFGDFDQTPERAIGRALAEGDLLLARQLVAAALPKPADAKSAVLLILAGELALRDVAAAKAQQHFEQALKLHPGHDAARKGLADAMFQQGRMADARRLAALGPAPEHVKGDADLQLWVAKRRHEFQHHLRMALDPGVRPNPSIADQVVAELPKPAVPEFLPTEPAGKGVKAKGGNSKGKAGKAAGRKASSGKAGKTKMGGTSP